MIENRQGDRNWQGDRGLRKITRATAIAGTGYHDGKPPGRPQGYAPIPFRYV